MKILLDTNILLRLKVVNDDMHPKVVEKLIALTSAHHTLTIAPQSLYEFYTVATRPSKINGLGLSSEDARKELESLTQQFNLLGEPANLYQYWLTLIDRYSIKGKRSHDVRLVAFMQAHNIPAIYTYNRSDFKAFLDIISWAP